MDSPRRTGLCLALLLGFAATESRADGGFWPADGVPIGNHIQLDGSPVLVSDGFGGTIAAWSQAPVGGGNYKVFVNRVYPNGNLPGYWDLGGRAAGTLSGADEFAPAAAADGQGGVIVAWLYRGKIRAQRITGGNSYAPGWPSTGVLVSNGDGVMSGVTVVSDAFSGAFVAWQEDDSLTGDNDIFIQHLGADGSLAPGWPERGIALCSVAGEQAGPRMVKDESGGAIVAWRDGSNGYVYGRRVTAAGTFVAGWDENGNTGALLMGIYATPTGGLALVGDKSNGAYVAVSGIAVSTSEDIFVQHVSEQGAGLWGATGIDASPTDQVQANPGLVIDSVRNVVVAWEDERDGPSGDIYAQRLSPAGDLRWSAAGVALCTHSSLQRRLQLVDDANGGAIALWVDGRGENVYAQRVDSLGTVKWTPNGVALTNSNAVPQTHGLGAQVDGVGGAFVTWFDSRSSGDGVGVYEARVDSTGNTGTAAVAVGAVAATAIEGVVEIGWDAFVSDAAEFQVLRSRTIAEPGVSVSGVIQALSGRQRYSYRDASAEPGIEYVYRIEYREGGRWLAAGSVRVTAPLAVFTLREPSPNPSRGSVRVAYGLGRAGEARLDVFDVRGVHVRSLFSGPRGASNFTAEWDGRDDAGRAMPAGLYFARLASGGGALSRRILRVP